MIASQALPSAVTSWNLAFLQAGSGSHHRSVIGHGPVQPGAAGRGLSATPPHAPAPHPPPPPSPAPPRAAAAPAVLAPATGGPPAVKPPAHPSGPGEIGQQPIVSPQPGALPAPRADHLHLHADAPKPARGQLGVHLAGQRLSSEH